MTPLGTKVKVCERSFQEQKKGLRNKLKAFECIRSPKHQRKTNEFYKDMRKLCLFLKLYFK